MLYVTTSHQGLPSLHQLPSRKMINRGMGNLSFHLVSCGQVGLVPEYASLGCVSPVR